MEPDAEAAPPSSSKSGSRNWRWWIPAVILGLTLLLIGRFHFAQSSFRYYTYVFGPIACAYALWMWYIHGTDQPKELRKTLTSRTRIGFVIVLVLFGLFFRYDGSWKGTSLVKFTWRWAPKASGNLESPAVPAAVEATSATEEEPLAHFHLDWPRYLGPNGDGSITGIGLSRDWEANPPTLLWKQEIGIGLGSFAVVGRRAITMEQRGEEELVTCYDLETGALLWSQAEPIRFEGPMGGPGPRSTPTIHEGLVYSQSAGGGLMCLNLETGEVVWRRNVLSEIGRENLKYGKANSPLIVDDKLIVTGGIEGPGLIAYDRLSGMPLWKAEEAKASYATPIHATFGGREQLISVNWFNVSGHDPDTGETIWRWPWEDNWPKPSQPHVVGDDQLLVTASYGQGAYVLKVPPGSQTAEPVWRNLRMKTKFSNAVVKGDYAYGLDEGILACIELATGDRLWKGGRYGFGQNILIDDLLLVQAEDGYLVLVEATPEDFNELATLDALEGTTWNVPALAGSYLLVRNSKEAACYLLPREESTP